MNYSPKSIFLPYLPPSANARLGRGKYGNSYLKTEARNFQTILEREFKKRFGDECHINTGKLWKISFFVLGDWGSYEKYIVNGYKLTNSVGNIGNEESVDLDNMAKDVIDALKKVVVNDDRYVNEIHQYKIQWPQKKGIVITISENRHYEATDLAELGVAADIVAQIVQQ